MQDAPPRISVAVPTRNRAAFLEKALASLVPQLTERDELLIVDNASTDNTAEVAARYAAGNPRIRVFREERLGLSAGRNKAHKEARASFVLFLDDDATVKPGWVEAYAACVERHRGEKVGCIAGACIPVYETAPPVWYNPKSEELDLGAKELPIRGDMRLPGGGNCAYNTEAVRAVGWFCHDLPRAQDTDMHVRFQAAGYEMWWLPGAPIYHFIPQKRLEFWRVAKAAFHEGKSYGRLRLRQKTGAAQRELYRIGRIAISAPYALWYGVIALLTFPFRRGYIAARAFKRAARVLGIGWQMTADLAAGKFSYS